MHTLLLRPTSLILVVVIACWLKGQLVYRLHGNFLHCALSLAAQSIVISPVCDLVFATGGRAGGVRTLLQTARAQCLRL